MSNSVYDQSGSSQKVRLVTKSDSTVYDPPLDALHVTTAGDIRITDMTDADVTVPSVPVGIWPQMCKKVWSTGTAAVVEARLLQESLVVR